jgi:hypothetical protein
VLFAAASVVSLAVLAAATAAAYNQGSREAEVAANPQ